jgi:hypothetical protein
MHARLTNKIRRIFPASIVLAHLKQCKLQSHKKYTDGSPNCLLTTDNLKKLEYFISNENVYCWC